MQQTQSTEWIDPNRLQFESLPYSRKINTEPVHMKIGQVPIIAINGAMHSGKSTLASYLIDHFNFHRSKIAKPLKDMLLVLGLTEEHIEGDLKDVPCDILFGHTPRHAMQTLGRDWRDTIHPDLWLRQLEARGCPAHCAGVVVDDFRFPNESEFFARRNALTIKIIRPGFESANDGYEPFLDTDLILINNGKIREFLTDARRAIRSMRPSWIARN